MAEVRTDPLVGRLLDGRYRVLSWLADGGMATVYSAMDERLERVVAVKVPRPDLAADDHFLQRFIGEAKAAARLSHPHVVAVYDQGTGALSPRPEDPTGPPAKIVYLAMEYVPGRTLRDELARHGPLAPRDALYVGRSIISALAAAHAAGLVHRDVKPENVLLADDRQVKVADFGLARAADEVSSGHSQGILLGTAAYVAPEQVLHGSADPRTDVYAAGVVLYEMLTGHPPYDGASAAEVAHRHVSEEIPAPSTVVPGLSPALDGVVLAATRRNPDERPADGAALLALLPSTIESSAPTAGPATDRTDRTEAMAPITDRNPVVPPRPVSAPGVHHTVAIPVIAAASAAGSARPRPVESALDSPEAPARTRRGRGPLALAAVFVVLAVAASLVWAIFYGPWAYTTTPSVLGLSEKRAQTVAEAAGLTLKVGSPVFSESVPAGQILTSDPKPGEQIPKNGEITIQLSGGKERHEVPDLRGRTVREARTELDAANLSLGDQTSEFDATVGEGIVISTDPKEGTKLKRDDAVSIVVSKGPAPISVPALVGQSQDAATAALSNLGLQVDVRTKNDSLVPAGIVISQDPAQADRVGPGEKVKIVVSSGPEMVTVPDVTGQNLTDAQQTLTNAGFQVQPAGPQQLNIVQGTNPPAGTSVAKGTLVAVFVS